MVLQFASIQSPPIFLLLVVAADLLSFFWKLTLDHFFLLNYLKDGRIHSQAAVLPLLWLLLLNARLCRRLLLAGAFLYGVVEGAVPDLRDAAHWVDDWEWWPRKDRHLQVVLPHHSCGKSHNLNSNLAVYVSNNLSLVLCSWIWFACLFADFVQCRLRRLKMSRIVKVTKIYRRLSPNQQEGVKSKPQSSVNQMLLMWFREEFKSIYPETSY